MTSHETVAPSTPSPAPTSQPQESSVQSVSITGQSGPSYPPHIYHPHAYTQLYNHSMPYTYGIPTTIPQSAPSPGAVGPTVTVPTPPPHSEPPPLPMLVASEEAKSQPAIVPKRGPGRPRKQPAGEIASGAVARKPYHRKGRTIGSQNWTARDLIALTHYVEEAIPLGMNVWKRIEGQYNNEYAILNNRQERGWDNMRDKWYKVCAHLCVPHNAVLQVDSPDRVRRPTNWSRRDA